MGRNFTKRDEEYIYKQVKDMTVEQVSNQQQLTPEQVQDIFSRMAERKKKDWGELEKLSLDEFSRQKGKRKFVTVVSDRGLCRYVGGVQKSNWRSFS
jgi:hypothetical protein